MIFKNKNKFLSNLCYITLNILLTQKCFYIYPMTNSKFRYLHSPTMTSILLQIFKFKFQIFKFSTNEEISFFSEIIAHHLLYFPPQCRSWNKVNPFLSLVYANMASIILGKVTLIHFIFSMTSFQLSDKLCRFTARWRKAIFFSLLLHTGKNRYNLKTIVPTRLKFCIYALFYVIDNISRNQIAIYKHLKLLLKT